KLDIAVAGNQDDRNVRVDFMNAAHQRHAVDGWHADVGDHRTVESLGDEMEGVLGAGEIPYLEARQVECLRRRVAQFFLVIDQENDRRFHSAASCVTGRAAFRRSVKDAPPSGWFVASSSPPKSLTIL